MNFLLFVLKTFIGERENREEMEDGGRGNRTEQKKNTRIFVRVKKRILAALTETKVDKKFFTNDTFWLLLHFDVRPTNTYSINFTITLKFKQ